MKKYYKTDSWKIMAQSELPFLPTPMPLIEKIFDYLKENNLINKKSKLIDLGAGEGRIIIYATERFGIKTCGLEIDRKLITIAKKNIKLKKIRSKCKIIEADLYNYDISSFPIIFCFTIPSSNRYMKHIIEKAKIGTIVISIRWQLQKFETLLEEFHKIGPFDDYNAFIYRRL